MARFRQFELMEDLVPYGNARALLLRWTGRGYEKTTEEVRVFDFVGMHGDRSDRGYAVLSPESECWEAFSGLYEQVAGWLP